MFIETESWKGIVNKNLLKKSQNKLHHIKDKVIADQSKFSFLRNDNNSEIFRILNKVKKKFLNLDKLILIGTGGSSLGSKAFLSILNSKRVTFLENIDPRTLDILITKYSKKKLV